MTRVATLVLGLVLTSIAACTPTLSQSEEPGELPILQSWHGDYPVAALDRLPPEQRDSRNGYLNTQDSFAAVWHAFQPGKSVPEVDFAEHLVLFTRNIKFYNRTSIIKVTLTDGVAEILAIETMSAMPIEDKVAMSMVVVPRPGIKAVRVSADQQLPIK